MNYQFAGAVLLALLASLLPALVHKEHWREMKRALASPLLMLNELLMGENGAVVQTYLYPGSGTVPATTAQAVAVYVQTVQVSFADADTTAPITHNWGLGTTGAWPNTGQRMPEVFLVWENAGTAYPALSVTWTNGSIITLGKGSVVTGSGGTVTVTMRRPHSVGQ